MDGGSDWGVRPEEVNIVSPAAVLDSVADAVSSAFGGGPKRALSPAAINRQISKVNRRTQDRAADFAKTRAYRRRWAQLTEDEIVDLIERRQASKSSRSC